MATNIPLVSQAVLDSKVTEINNTINTTVGDKGIPYAATAGSANAYTVTLSPAPTAYKDGMAVAVKINIANTGASTININGLGAKSIVKPNGTALVSGNLTASGVYTLRYNGTNFILQGSTPAGTATPADVLTGKTFDNDTGTTQTGSMVNRGATVITPSTANQAIQAGYHNGSGYCAGAATLKAENIKDGVKIFNVTGNLKGGLFTKAQYVLYNIANGPTAYTENNIKGYIPVTVPDPANTVINVSGWDNTSSTGRNLQHLYYWDADNSRIVVRCDYWSAGSAQQFIHVYTLNPEAAEIVYSQLITIGNTQSTTIAIPAPYNTGNALVFDGGSTGYADGNYRSPGNYDVYNRITYARILCSSNSYNYYNSLHYLTIIGLKNL